MGMQSPKGPLGLDLNNLLFPPAFVNAHALTGIVPICAPDAMPCGSHIIEIDVGDSGLDFSNEESFTFILGEGDLADGSDMGSLS